MVHLRTQQAICERYNQTYLHMSSTDKKSREIQRERHEAGIGDIRNV